MRIRRLPRSLPQLRRLRLRLRMAPTAPPTMARYGSGYDGPDGGGCAYSGANDGPYGGANDGPYSGAYDGSNGSAYAGSDGSSHSRTYNGAEGARRVPAKSGDPHSKLPVHNAAPRQSDRCKNNAHLLPPGWTPSEDQRGQEPQLAESWEMQPDGKTYTWNLRQGVPFYKNAEATDIMFSAKDAVHSFGIFAGVESELTRSGRPEFGGMVDADIVNDHQVVLRLAQVSLDMPFLLSDEWSTGISSKDWWDQNGEEGYMDDPIGTGPWSLIELKTNQYVLHERVLNHWRITPEFSEVEFIFVPESATRLAMIIGGEAHIAAIPRDLHIQAEERGIVITKSTLPRGTHSSPVLLLQAG